MGAHAIHDMHTNSIASFQAFPLAEREQVVMGVFDASTHGLTDRQVAERLGVADMNYVRPSITKLTQACVLREYGSVKDHVTGRSVRISGRPEAA